MYKCFLHLSCIVEIVSILIFSFWLSQFHNFMDQHLFKLFKEEQIWFQFTQFAWFTWAHRLKPICSNTVTGYRPSHQLSSLCSVNTQSIPRKAVHSGHSSIQPQNQNLILQWKIFSLGFHEEFECWIMIILIQMSLNIIRPMLSMCVHALITLSIHKRSYYPFSSNGGIKA